MTPLKIKLLAFKGAPDAAFENANTQIQKHIASENYVLVDENPDVLYFLSGGSEMPATEVVAPVRFYLLIGSRHNNSYASATEVKAWMNARGIQSLLLDAEEAETREVLENFLKVRTALEKLKGQRAGLIGNVSDWLIASAIDANILKEKNRYGTDSDFLGKAETFFSIRTICNISAIICRTQQHRSAGHGPCVFHAHRNHCGQ